MWSMSDPTCNRNLKNHVPYNIFIVACGFLETTGGELTNTTSTVGRFTKSTGQAHQISRKNPAGWQFHGNLGWQETPGCLLKKRWISQY